MTKRRQHVSGDNLCFDLIPIDLVTQILSRLPVKSLAKCRCVSKLWSSIISSPNYNQLFPIMSAATPRFLFIIKNNAELVFYSSPQNLDKIPSLVFTFHTKKNMPFRYYCKICPPVNGLVCLEHIGHNYTHAVISNPITGEYVTTPRLITETFMFLKEKMYFGYDPIEKQFKVMCMTWFSRRKSYEHQVLTLGTGNLSWRKIQCATLHHPHDVNGICINGVLYYQAMIDQKRSIVCFDVRSEKFSFVNVDQLSTITKTKIWKTLSLINYKNKLGVIHCGLHFEFFDLWVLENAEEHKWSYHFKKFPQVLLHPRLLKSRFSAKMIQSGEILLYPNSAENPFSILYYNLEKNMITSVDLQVPAVDDGYGKVCIFPNFVEDVMLM